LVFELTEGIGHWPLWALPVQIVTDRSCRRRRNSCCPPKGDRDKPIPAVRALNEIEAGLLGVGTVSRSSPVVLRYHQKPRVEGWMQSGFLFPKNPQLWGVQMVRVGVFGRHAIPEMASRFETRLAQWRSTLSAPETDAQCGISGRKDQPAGEHTVRNRRSASPDLTETINVYRQC